MAAGNPNNLQRYGDFAPTPFDNKGAFLDSDRQNWLIAPASQTRDSGPLDRSNYTAQLAAIEEVDPEGENHEEHRFGHWGPGWFEIVIVRPDSPCANVAAEIQGSLEDYPVLDEESFCELEEEEANETWNNCFNLSERIDLCREAGVSIFAARRDYYPNDDSGRIRERLIGN